MKKGVPESLRIWFLVHFVADLIFAVPLILFPDWLFGLFGIYESQAGFVMARLVGAALLGIGGTSFLINKKGRESYNSLLTLKVIWSVSAIAALILSIINGAPRIVWTFVVVYAVFSSVWIYYKIKLQ